MRNGNLSFGLSSLVDSVSLSDKGCDDSVPNERNSACVRCFAVAKAGNTVRAAFIFLFSPRT